MTAAVEFRTDVVRQGTNVSAFANSAREGEDSARRTLKDHIERG